MDDSIVRVMLGREMVLRRARGYAPLPVSIPVAADVGGFKHQSQNRSRPPHVRLSLQNNPGRWRALKNSVALAVGDQVLSASTSAIWKRNRRTMPSAASSRILRSFTTRNRKSSPRICTRIISRRNLPWNAEGRLGVRQTRNIGPSRCSVFRGLFESSTTSPMFSHAWRKMKSGRPRLAFRGTAPATDWTARSGAGNFSRSRTRAPERFAHLRPFRLPGGDAAVKEPRRAALGLSLRNVG